MMTLGKRLLYSKKNPVRENIYLHSSVMLNIISGGKGDVSTRIKFLNDYF